jgi:hypothetical protein
MNQGTYSVDFIFVFVFRISILAEQCLVVFIHAFCCAIMISICAWQMSAASILCEIVLWTGMLFISNCVLEPSRVTRASYILHSGMLLSYLLSLSTFVLIFILLPCNALM